MNFCKDMLDLLLIPNISNAIMQLGQLFTKRFEILTGHLVILVGKGLLRRLPTGNVLHENGRHHREYFTMQLIHVVFDMLRSLVELTVKHFELFGFRFGCGVLVFVLLEAECVGGGLFGIAVLEMDQDVWNDS